jgi:hypothetical protein
MAVRSLVKSSTQELNFHIFFGRHNPNRPLSGLTTITTSNLSICLLPPYRLTALV